MVVINPQANFTVMISQVFDTYKLTEKLDLFIKGNYVEKGYIVVAACKDDCSTKLTTEHRNWFAEFGSKEIWNLDYRDGFVFVAT